MASEATEPRQAVAIIGGAVSGAQLASMLAEAGIEVCIFEQNRRPFGKIEDGLPRWHAALRKKEYDRITKILSHPRVHVMPMTRVGEDVGFQALLDEWGFTAVVLACGAWRDRPLAVEGAEAWVNKGLVYQNPFIVAFNHAEDSNYDGPTFDVLDDSLVVGGGLASIDVAKLHMLELTRRELKERGHEVDVEELEKAGLDRYCESVGLKWDDLGLKGATLIYRREPEDMPLQEAPAGADEARIQKVRGNRKKMLERTMDKYKFRFESLCTPEGLIVEGDRVVGLKMRRLSKGEGRKLHNTDETFELRGAQTIASIGSIPSPIEGVPMKGELFGFIDWELGRLPDQPRVFSVGNVVTGKGNIVASRRHAKGVGETLLASYLGLTETTEAQAEAMVDVVAGKSTEQAEEVKGKVEALPALEDGKLAGIRTRAKARQDAVGFDGDLEAWVAKYPPA